MTSSNEWRLTPAGRVLPPKRLASEAAARDYAVVVVEDNYLSFHAAGPHSLSSLDHQAQLMMLRALLTKLANLHTAGYEAGNATIEHVLVDKKSHEPFFDAITHLAPLDKQSHGVNEVLTLLASFRKPADLTREELSSLISHYLDAEPGRREGAEDFLRAHMTKNQDQDHARHAAIPHNSLEDRLLERLERRYHLFFAP